MRTYLVDIIDWGNGGKHTSKICHGLEEVWKLCGFKLKRERSGYAGFIGHIEYRAVAIA